MIGAVAWTSMAMAPAIISGKQTTDGLGHIVFTTGAGLEYRHAGSGMGHEDRNEAVAPSTTEGGNGPGQVREGATRRVKGNKLAVHELRD